MFIIRGEKMSLLNFILRLPYYLKNLYYNNNVIYENDTIKWFVEKWLKYVYFEPYTFCTILSRVGIRTPVVLSDFDVVRGSFKCESITGQEVIISLNNGDLHNSFSEIQVMYDNNKTEIYSIGVDYKSNVVTILEGRELSKEKRFLSSSYGPYYSQQDLNFGDGRILNIHIDVPKIYRCNLESARIKSMQNCLDIEQFLIDLPDDFSLSAIYESSLKTLGYSDPELVKCDSIEFYYHKEIDGINSILGRIELINGNIDFWKDNNPEDEDNE